MKSKKLRKRRRREKSITLRTLRIIVLIGIILVIGVSLAAGVPFFERNLEVYEELTCNHLKVMQRMLPDGEVILKYLETGKKDDKYQEVFDALTTTAIEASLRYVYVVVPLEKEMIYIWDTGDIQEPGVADQMAEYLEPENY